MGVLQIEDERRQRHLTHTNKSRLTSFNLKTAERRPTGAGVLVESNTVAEIISDEGLDFVGEHGQQHSCRQYSGGDGPHRLIDRLQYDPVFVHMLAPVAAFERKR